MGITGLLPFIKNSCRPVNLRDFKGATVAIDAYSWLHKGAFSCAEKLVKGEKTDGYVHYCVKQLNMLLDIGVKPIMVFDGCNLESKAVTERKRRENRERTRQKGKEYLCQGKIKEARECFQRCVDVTPEMAYEVIQVCKSKGIDYVVAPYEADAQLAYLNIADICQIVITEDSDLVLFGCEKILFKMDSCGGGMLYEKENLPKSFGINAEKMSFDKFRYMCILSGCDYLPSLPGIGLAKACKFFTLVRNPDLHCVLPKLPSYLKMPKLIVSPEYIESFIKANNTFLYQVVFCPRKKALVPLNPYPEGVDASNMEYAGRYFPDELAQQIAMGDVNVKTLKKFEGFSPPPKKIGSSSSANKNSNSIWSHEKFEVKSQKSSQELKTFFKIKQTSPKSVISPSVKKRTFCETDKDGNRDLQYQLLFSLYSSGSSQQKKHKPDDDEEPVQNLNIQSPEHNKNTEGAIPKHVLPFQKAPKWATTAPLQKIVKSRFFVNSSKGTEKQQQTEKQSVCLDTTDREYHNSAQEFSENVQAPVSETAAASSSPEDPYVETVPPSTDATVPCPSPSSTENSIIATVTDDSLVVEAEEKENAQQCLLVGNFRHCAKPKGGYNHSLGSCGSSFNESFESLATEEDGDRRLHSSSDVSTFPSKKTAFGSPSRHASRRPLSDLECEVLSFDLDSLEDCASVSSVQDKGNSKNSIVSKSSKTRCRTVGLSRNRPKSVRQLSMQDTLFNFKFTKLPKMEAKNT